MPEENLNRNLGFMFRMEKVALFAVFETYLRSPELFDDEAKLSIEEAMADIASQIGRHTVLDARVQRNNGELWE